MDAIARIDRPMLLIHGDADVIVPASHSRRLQAASGGHAELVILPGAGHNTMRDTHPQVDQMMIDFFSAHLDTPR